jgi:hypothetical protein
VTFDGTGISVFELKRDIINISRLGDGTDFDFNIYNLDTNEGKEQILHAPFPAPSRLTLIRIQ